jgi:hypothetical protein
MPTTEGNGEQPAVETDGGSAAGSPCDEQLGLNGKLTAVLRGPDGEIKQVVVEENLIVTTGRDSIIEQLEAAPTAAKPTHMRVGTGGTAPVAGNTALQTEIGSGAALSTKNAAANVLTMIATFAAGNGTGALVEAGVFCAATGATSAAAPMYSRATFSVINKAAGDSLELTWTYTLTVP